MESLNLWIIELCVCAVAIAVAENLLPEGNVKKSVYFVLGLVVVTCFVSPIEKIELAQIEIKSETDLTEENTDWLNRTTDEIFENNVRALIEKCLADIDVEPKKIYIHTDINEDNCIFIDKVRITLAPEYSGRIDETADEIYRTLGLDADVNVR
ncbi:MAG: stage III sporulation protein AF [Clostridia bacterium]|nr:stage III sporulation protein AF [Clostridia bacterium]